MSFDDNNMFKVSSEILHTLIGKDELRVKELLKNKLSALIPNIESVLDVFGTYTFECLIIHILGSVFNALNEKVSVRCSYLIDQLDKGVWYQACTEVSKDKLAELVQTKIKKN